MECLANLQDLPAKANNGKYKYSCRFTGKGGHALPPATQTYMPQALRLQRDLGRQADDLIASLSALEPMQTASGAVGVPEEEVAAAHQRVRLEMVNLASAFSTFQQLSSDLSAGLDASQQIDAEVEHLLRQVCLIDLWGIFCECLIWVFINQG